MCTGWLKLGKAAPAIVRALGKKYPILLVTREVYIYYHSATSLDYGLHLQERHNYTFIGTKHIRQSETSRNHNYLRHTHKHMRDLSFVHQSFWSKHGVGRI